MTLGELCVKWETRQQEWRRLDVLADAAKLAAEIIADLNALHHAQTMEAVTLKEASAIGGYSIDHLQRLVAARQLENVGRKGRPRIRRGDVPIKRSHSLQGLHNPTNDVISERRRIVASVATHGNEEPS